MDARVKQILGVQKVRTGGGGVQYTSPISERVKGFVLYLFLSVVVSLIHGFTI